MSLDGLVAQVQGLSGSEADLASLHAALKAQQAESVLRQNAGSLLSALQALDAATHSLGCLFIL